MKKHCNVRIGEELVRDAEMQVVCCLSHSSSVLSALK